MAKRYLEDIKRASGGSIRSRKVRTCNNKPDQNGSGQGGSGQARLGCHEGLEATKVTHYIFGAGHNYPLSSPFMHYVLYSTEQSFSCFLLKPYIKAVTHSEELQWWNI